jgi:hypothetical protein
MRTKRNLLRYNHQTLGGISYLLADFFPASPSPIAILNDLLPSPRKSIQYLVIAKYPQINIFCKKILILGYKYNIQLVFRKLHDPEVHFAAPSQLFQQNDF